LRIDDVELTLNVVGIQAVGEQDVRCAEIDLIRTPPRRERRVHHRRRRNRSAAEVVERLEVPADVPAPVDAQVVAQ